jgi:hypothetical protein
MLAEIFLLRMEAIYRASEESAPTGYSQLVPITATRFSTPAVADAAEQGFQGRGSTASPREFIHR